MTLSFLRLQEFLRNVSFLKQEKQLRSKSIMVSDWRLPRHPEKEEVEILKELYSSQLKYYKSKPSEAYKLVNVGETPYNRGLSLSKTAAMTLVANTLLNHNETYTKR